MNINDYNAYSNKYCLTYYSVSFCSNSSNSPPIVIYYSSDNFKMAKRCQDNQDYILNELSPECNELYDRVKIDINEAYFKY